MKAIFITLAAIISTSLQAGEFKEDAHTLFLAHFNKQIGADFTKGNPEPTGGSATITAGGGGKFGEGLWAKTEPFTNKLGKPDTFYPLSYPLDGNLNLGVGTLEFWIKMDFSAAPEKATPLYYLFDIPSMQTDNKDNLIRFTVVVVGQQGKKYLHVFPGMLDGQTNKAIVVAVDWEKGEWHHIAVTWDKQEVALFVDGHPTKSMATQGGLFDGNPAYTQDLKGIFLIGGLWKSDGSQGPDGIIDELRISDVVRYTADFEPNK
ncbi:MAG: LamG domain-containing protein [Verrucomicrobia bacterium]|nr:LamG domain-containing protein [Verrucomicrobiota bacterium]